MILKNSALSDELPLKKSLKIQNDFLSISNKDFSAIYNAMESDKIIILDARENLEYDIGHIPGSTHIRFADLQNGVWKNLNT